MSASCGPSLWFYWLVLLASAPVSCLPEGSSSDLDDAGTDGEVPEETSCEDWKESYCEFVDACSLGTKNSCFEQIDGLKCRINAPLTRCVRELHEGCDQGQQPSTECTPLRVADTTQAKADCLALRSAYCDSLASCDPVSAESICGSTLDTELPCERAYATSGNYELCMKLLEDEDCEWALPDSCVGVIDLK